MVVQAHGSGKRSFYVSSNPCFVFPESVSIAEQNHSDLVPGKYEGGLKVWECTRDLADFLTSKNDIDWTNKTVLDLGCGAGLLGLIPLLQGAKVVFHDYVSLF